MKFTFDFFSLRILFDYQVKCTSVTLKDKVDLQ